MNEYLKAVTLGAFTWKDENRIALLLEYIRKAGNVWLVLHFLLLTLCLNFPVIFSITRLSPHELYSRLYPFGYEQLTEGSGRETEPERSADEFNASMLESGYGRTVLMPILGMTFGLVLIIQIVFYFSAVFFVGLSRLNVTFLSFRDRMGMALYSSTLPVLLASLFGLYLPTVHIIIFYFLVMFFVFQRSKLCPEG